MARKLSRKPSMSNRTAPQPQHTPQREEPSAHDGALEQDDAPIQVTEAEVLATLTHGELSEQGLLPYSSNHSFW